ncbi:hypothetical protein KVF89_25395 [Nocardioides carbamazepini]|uniref:hypothetical protein n=1 Tax=Nocardioides carbamazepini TaxID=2854259 RepID=UPI00214A4406|nr:hypothetical protein [Nocardioides carbamazepini]MCR1785895.1 hypothetical protein [Nocardioides carbamazepini]
MRPADPLARGRRRRIVTTAVLAVFLLGAVAAKITSMQIAQTLGERAWRSGDPAAAERLFSLTGRLNVVQRWISPFNRGVAAHERREWADAADWFEQAMALAPESARCRVALSWAWSLEAAGDELASSGDPAAAGRWSAAKSVLGQVDECEGGGAAEPPRSSSSAQETEGRLDDKLSNGAADGSDEPGTEQRTESSREQQQAERLDERNRGAAQDKRRAEDQQQQSEEPVDGPDRTW